MSDEQPRMSRREMRAKGLLAPILDGASPLDDLTPTAEIRLKRLTRKEMREREGLQGQTSQTPAVSSPSVAESTKTSERTSESFGGASDDSRWRHVDDDPEVVATFARESGRDEGGAPTAHATSTRATGQTPRATGHATGTQPRQVLDAESSQHVGERSQEGVSSDSDSRVGEAGADEQPRTSVFGRFEQETDSPPDGATDEEGDSQKSLKAPLLERLHRDGRQEGDAHSDVPVAPEPVAAILGAQGAEPSGDAEVPQSEYDAELSEVLEDEKPRGWLMLIVAIFFGLLLGVPIGLVIRHVLMSDGVQPILDAASAHGLPGF